MPFLATKAKREFSARTAAAAAALFAVQPGAASAAPDFGRGELIGDIQIYQDDANERQFYFAPRALTLARSDDGRPDMRLFIARYTGSSLRNDVGGNFVRSFIQFKLRLDSPSADAVDGAMAQLRQRHRGRLKLSPVPIQRIDGGIIFAPLESAAGEDASADGRSGAALGEIEPTGAEKSGSYWQERDFVVPLDPRTAELLWDQLPDGALLLSFGYAFFANGTAAQTPPGELTGSPELLAMIEDRLPDAIEGDTGEGLQMIAAGVEPVQVEAGDWPSLFQRFDLNAEAPPGYPVLRIYCFDFSDALSEALFERAVEIEAEGVAGGTVTRRIVFNARAPEIFAQSVRFPFAVKLDAPYRYRIVSVLDDGEELFSDWRAAETWTETLDITSRPDEGFRIVPEDDGEPGASADEEDLDSDAAEAPIN